MFLESELSKVEAGRRRLIDSVADGLFSKEEVTSKIEEIRQRENLFRSEVAGITAQLRSGPTEEEVRRKPKSLQRMIEDIYRSPSRLAKMSFDERRKLLSTFFGGKDAQGRRLGVYLEKDQETEAVRYEIRGTFDQTFQGKITPGDLDIKDFKDVNIEHHEDLKAAVIAGGGKPKSLKSLGVQDRPYHDKENSHSKDLRIEPHVEQWVAWGNIHLMDLTSFL